MKGLNDFLLKFQSIPLDFIKSYPGIKVISRNIKLDHNQYTYNNLQTT